MNLWPAEDVAGIRAGLAAVSLPLRDRLVGDSGKFGVGMWFPAKVARALARDGAERDELTQFLIEERIDAFTFNAFPFGDFHKQGLKSAVFEPDWRQQERSAFTRDVAAFGLHFAGASGWANGRHLSISTHSGAHMGNLDGGTSVQELRGEVARNMLRSAGGIATLCETQSDSTSCTPTAPLKADGQPGERVELHGSDWHSDGDCAREAGNRPPVVIGIEPEPRSLAGDTRELVPLWQALEQAEQAAAAITSPACRLGVCLDACHSAIEFESAAGAITRATGGTCQTRRPIAKLQFSSALRLANPGADPAGFAALLAMDEPVYLHQVTGQKDGVLKRAGDLNEVAAESAIWQAQDELRCHFHVPVDLESMPGHGGLATTSAFATELLAQLLHAPDSWGTQELHVEIETYTWSLDSLQAATGTDLVDGIESEYRHVIALLAAAGWGLSEPH